MTKPLETYKPFDVIVIPFPFSDKLAQKKRPALVLSTETFNETTLHVITAMITSAKQSSWPLDSPILDIQGAGLPVPCLVRMKFYTVDQSQIIRRIGSLSKADLANFKKNFKQAIMM